MQIILKNYSVFVHNFDKKLLRFVFYGVIMDLSKRNEDKRQKKRRFKKCLSFWLVGYPVRYPFYW